MSDILTGKVVIVTGVSTRIGRAIAIGAGRHGARVVIVADVDEATPGREAAVVSEIESLGGAAHFVRTDVCDPRQVEALVAEAGEFGGVDVMVANAGTLDGTLYCAQAAAQRMRARGRGGSIVLMASLSEAGAAGSAIHSTLRGSIVLMAKHLAGVVGSDGIRVNSVCQGRADTAQSLEYPSGFETFDELRKRTPFHRRGTPAEIADAVAWLGSDMSSHVSGIALPVTVGQAAWSHSVNHAHA